MFRVSGVGCWVTFKCSLEDGVLYIRGLGFAMSLKRYHSSGKQHVHGEVPAGAPPSLRSDAKSGICEEVRGEGVGCRV